MENARLIIVFVAVLIVTFVPHARAGGEHHTPWSYEGTTGPDHWGELDPAFALAKDGKSQSPINITTRLTKDLFDEIAWQSSATITVSSITNNGHTIVVNATDASTITIDTSTYALSQFHVHHPSEHTLDGVRYPMEIHFVHRHESGALLVLAFFVREGAPSAFLAQYDSFLPLAPGEERPMRRSTLGVQEIVTGEQWSLTSQVFYGYIGSLTTPPCTESVSWLVAAETVTATPEQIDAFRLPGHESTARPIQARNDRPVFRVRLRTH